MISRIVISYHKMDFLASNANLPDILHQCQQAPNNVMDLSQNNQENPTVIQEKDPEIIGSSRGTSVLEIVQNTQNVQYR